MGSYDGATIEVINWDKYNPRTDSKRPSWFRLENTLATGPGFHGLDCEQKWLWIVVLSLVSQKNGGAIEWNSAYISAITGIKPKKQDETLAIFEKFVRLRVSREVTPSNILSSHATDGRTDEHNLCEFDFESLYKKYPRKIGKSEGIKKCQKQIKSLEDFESLSTAIDRYVNYCRAQGTEEKFVKHFSSFMSSWRDWLDVPASKSPVLRAKDLSEL